VRESTSDIEFITEETDQVARQFRQVTNQLQEGRDRAWYPLLRSPNGCPRRARHFVGMAAVQIEGQTLIDKVILEQLYDPMTHLVNNYYSWKFRRARSAQTSLLWAKSPFGLSRVTKLLSLLPMMELELTQTVKGNQGHSGVGAHDVSWTCTVRPGLVPKTK